VSKPFLVLLAAAVAIAMIVAGCGGSNDSSSEGSSSLTKAEFVKQGNAICAKGSEEIETGFKAFEKENNSSENKQPSKAMQMEAAETILIPSVRKQVEGIRDLAAPSGEEQKVDKILSAAEEGIEKSEEDPTILITGSANPFGKSNKLASEYGLVKCGE
jgi:hypothetical protein